MQLSKVLNVGVKKKKGRTLTVILVVCVGFNCSSLCEGLALTPRFFVLNFYLRIGSSHRKPRFLRPHLSLLLALLLSLSETEFLPGCKNSGLPVLFAVSIVIYN